MWWSYWVICIYIYMNSCNFLSILIINYTFYSKYLCSENQSWLLYDHALKPALSALCRLQPCMTVLLLLFYLFIFFFFFVHEWMIFIWLLISFWLFSLESVICLLRKTWKSKNMAVIIVLFVPCSYVLHYYFWHHSYFWCQNFICIESYVRWDVNNLRTDLFDSNRPGWAICKIQKVGLGTF